MIRKTKQVYRNVFDLKLLAKRGNSTVMPPLEHSFELGSLSPNEKYKAPRFEFQRNCLDSNRKTVDELIETIQQTTLSYK
ncbi:hypothetical protein CHS0354_012832 [Potamilus streckersoni]|uniref:Uncharacterized protein n=1 Tax=Potamilus streckersoni TaxID=2493646 RepID=A0AAE0SW02_9BIVA|nr:hypothetical protein CHS0354_012832 [Potamilus streckersoni]